VLVVIPVYNLPSEEQTYSMTRNLREIIPSVHVLIVNNSPSENSYRKLQEISDWYFVAGENMGIGFAYNLALLLAKLTNERWILIIDFFFIKSLPTFVLALYEQSDLLTTLKLLLRAIYYSLPGNLDRDNRIFILKNKKIMRGSP
jgi:hypothetical protein